jgi:flagellar assembly factor FliW
MKFQTTRFGEIEIPDGHVYEFVDGLLGFPDYTHYGVVDNPGGGPFQWLQCRDEPHLAFVICDPHVFRPEYKVSVGVSDLELVGLEDPAGGVVMVILTVPRHDPMAMTANLLGPLLFNPEAGKARQLVLSDGDYTTRELVFDPAAPAADTEGEA